MIRSGKSSSVSWLQAPRSQFAAWAALSGISMTNVHVGIPKEQGNEDVTLEGEAQGDKGSGIIADAALESETCPPLMEVPEYLVLSKQRVHEIATGDTRFSELLTECGKLALSSRTSIMIFLLHQATMAYPEVERGLGRSTEFIGYLKQLPIPPVPTLYSDLELSTLRGTTLYPAVIAKSRSLRKEFDALRKSTERLSGISELWWGESLSYLSLSGLNIDDPVDNGDDGLGLVKFEDWVILDGIYRSRALEWPGKDEAIVPGVDMANHFSPPNTLYEVHDGSGYLLLKKGNSVQAGEELCISYGDEKSAMEMLFAYGFIPSNLSSTQSILITLPSPEEDPLAPAKVAAISQESVVPGIRIYRDGDTIKWDSEAIWLMILNQEDGLDFKVMNRDDDELEVRISFKGEIVSIRDLKTALEKEELWDVLKLRSMVIILGQIENQLEKLDEGENLAILASVDASIQDLATRLRSMETGILRDAVRVLEGQKEELLGSEVVDKYLRSINDVTDSSDTFDDVEFS